MALVGRHLGTFTATCKTIAWHSRVLRQFSSSLVVNAAIQEITVIGGGLMGSGIAQVTLRDARCWFSVGLAFAGKDV